MAKDILAVIPARGGSKGIPRKNLLDLGGNPLVEHSIRHALASSLVSRVLVSTDDDEIASVALRGGAEVPFLRPKALAGDEVLDQPVFEHVLRELEAREGYLPDLVVHLRPTAPYRKPEWIDAAITALLNNKEADSLRSVSEPSQHPYRVFEIDERGYLSALMKHRHPRPYELRRQELPRMYYYNCVIDVTRPNTVLALRSMTGDRILPFVMDAEEVIDIDSRRDLEVARLLFFGGQ